MHFFQGPFDEVSNWLSYHNFDFINLNSTIYITTPHKVAWSKLVVSALSSGGSDILGLSDGISTVRPEIEIESFNTTHVCVSRIPCSGRRSFDHEVYRSHCTQYFDSRKRLDFVGTK